MNIKPLIIFVLLLPLQAYAEKWYELPSPTDKVVAELTLKSGELKVVKIKSNKFIVVGFMAKITPKELHRYESLNIKPITVHYAPEKITMFGIGGGQSVVPINGEVKLEIKNNSEKTILVDIFKGKY